jgi:hypothetical protein
LARRLACDACCPSCAPLARLIPFSPRLKRQGQDFCPKKLGRLSDCAFSVRKFGAEENHDFWLCAGIGRWPECGRGIEEAWGGQGVREMASGAKTDRAQLSRLLGMLNAGDLLMVTRLDRLARSTRELLNILAVINGKKVGFRSVSDAWAGRSMLTALAGLAEFEKNLVHTRTNQGRVRAKARRVKFGRKPKLTEDQKREAIRRRDRDGEPVREIARSYNVSHSTISRLTAQ